MQDREIRGSDSQGSGHYLASRGKRKHMGIDFITSAHELITSYCIGTVTKIGFPYDPNKYPSKAHLRYVEVTDCDQIKVRVFYIQPLVDLGDIIELDTVIGKSQDLTEIYQGITQHLHFEVKQGNHFINPMQYLGITE